MTKDSVSLCTAYSVPYNRLVFVKSDDGSSGFSSTLEFSVDVLDSSTGKDYYRLKRRDVYARSYEETRSETRRAADYITTSLPRSDFRVLLELADGREKLTYGRSGTERNFSRTDSFSYGPIVFLDSLSNSGYYPVVPDGFALFPNPIRLLLVSDHVRTDGLTADLQTDAGLHIASVGSTTITGSIVPNTDGRSLFFTLDPDTTRGLTYIELKVDTLREGKYNLSLRSDAGTETLKFEYLWAGKPMTLRNFEMAMSLMRYIVTDSEYSEMESGNERERKDKFESFWKMKDPTPATAYYELEARYYERADYAYRQFSTIGTRNGAFTDRGKAYILYGKPEKIRRVFKDDATLEIWDYPNLKRSLVFKETGFGEFHLYQTEKL